MTFETSFCPGQGLNLQLLSYQFNKENHLYHTPSRHFIVSAKILASGNTRSWRQTNGKIYMAI